MQCIVKREREKKREKKKERNYVIFPDFNSSFVGYAINAFVVELIRGQF